MVLLQRAHQETMRYTDKIHMAGLPLAFAHLTVPQPQLLRAVPMEGLGARPADHQEPEASEPTNSLQSR